jgi:hypothetical protein
VAQLSTLGHIHAMRYLGITLLVVGFIWIAYDAAAGFTEYQYVRCIWQTQHLPAGDTIKRTDAAGAMRDLSLDLKDRHRVVFAPALLMLAGGLVAGFSQRKQKIDHVA